MTIHAFFCPILSAPSNLFPTSLHRMSRSMEVGNQIKLCNALLKRASVSLPFDGRSATRRQLASWIKSLKGTREGGHPLRDAQPALNRKRKKEQAPSPSAAAQRATPSSEPIPPRNLSVEESNSGVLSLNPAELPPTDALLVDIREMLLDGRVDDAIDHVTNESLWVSGCKQRTMTRLVTVGNPCH